MCLVYKCRNGLVETFSNVSAKHEHHTKAQTRQNLTLVKPKNNQLKQSFKYSGALNWNNLNPVIRNATSLNINLICLLKVSFYPVFIIFNYLFCILLCVILYKLFLSGPY